MGEMGTAGAHPGHHHPELVIALAAVKQAAAAANRDLGRLTDANAAAIVKACANIRGGAPHEQFVVDVIQGGAGTSTNMNANDVYPTAARIAIRTATEPLLTQLRRTCGRYARSRHIGSGTSSRWAAPSCRTPYR